MTEPKYLVCKDIAEARKILTGKGIDPGELLGEKPSIHIGRVVPIVTLDGHVIISIPSTLKSVQDAISLSVSASKLKTTKEIQAYFPDPPVEVMD